MRFEPSRVFLRSDLLPPWRVPSGIARDVVAPALTFLQGPGFDETKLGEARRRALAEGVGPARGLLAYGGVSESLFYRRLADHLGVAFDGKWPHLPQPFDALRALENGFVKLADGRWLIAPTDEALSILLAARDHVSLDRSRFALTTPAHLAALVRHRAEATIVHAASHYLPETRPRLSAKHAFDRATKIIASAAAVGAALAAYLQPAAMLDGLGMTFLLAMIFRLVVSAAGYERDRAAPVALKTEDAPFYSVLVPLYREAAMVPGLVSALERIDYPRSKLEVLFLVETDDRETRDALAAIDLSPGFRVVVVPDGRPRTKPRALNVGLFLARGTLLTVYDAEDRPDPDQLRRAADRFARAPARLACLQARLAISNGADGLLARLFAVEYDCLFDLYNVGLGRLGLPMALGGTSNHFRRDVLREIGGWDAWNVTEDADLGLRLARFGYTSDSLASTTYENALTETARWFLQRRRWTKGWMQTALVLARDWRAAFGDFGAARALAVAAMMINLVIGPLLMPLFALPVIGNLIVNGLPTPHGLIQVAEATIAYSVLTFGVCSTLWMGHAGSRDAGEERPWALLLLLPYQFLISLAAWCGLCDLVRAPHHWHKTEHRP